MNKLIRVAIGAVVIGALVAPASAALISSPFNTRPGVVIGASGEPTLQSILDGLWGAGAVSAVADQNSAGMWGFSSSIGSSIPTMVVEHAGLAGSNAFGVWFGTDSASLLHYDLLLGPADNNGITFDAASLVIAGNTLFVNSAGPGTCGVEVNCTAPVVGLTDARINTSSFGFYLFAQGTYFYTLDELNTGGAAGALAFRQPGTDTWAFAFEDIVGGDRDFNDMVVKVESIEAVPEPGTMLLLGSGILGLAARRRRNRS